MASFCYGCCGCWIPLTLRHCSCCHPQNHCPHQARPLHSEQQGQCKFRWKHFECMLARGGRKTHWGRAPSRTEERFLLLLKPPSLILRGATFLVLALFFFSCGFGAGFDFLRAFGPAAEQRAVSVSEFRTKFYSDICPLSSKAYLCLLLSWPCVEAAQVAAEAQLEPAVLQLPVQPQPPWFQRQQVHWQSPTLRWRQQLLSGGYWCWTLATWLREPSSFWTRQS